MQFFACWAKDPQPFRAVWLLKQKSGNTSESAPRRVTWHTFYNKIMTDLIAQARPQLQWHDRQPWSQLTNEVLLRDVKRSWSDSSLFVVNQSHDVANERTRSSSSSRVITASTYWCSSTAVILRFLRQKLTPSWEEVESLLTLRVVNIVHDWI